jgi:hypothetical protein
MRKTSFLILILFWAPAFAQDSQNDVIQALRQQREEALDKVANAYVTIMKLQRELDRLNAASQKPEAPPKASADAPPK